jgi:hypothetical protein
MPGVGSDEQSFAGLLDGGAGPTPATSVPFTQPPAPTPPFSPAAGGPAGVSAATLSSDDTAQVTRTLDSSPPLSLDDADALLALDVDLDGGPPPPPQAPTLSAPRTMTGDLGVDVDFDDELDGIGPPSGGTDALSPSSSSPPLLSARVLALAAGLQAQGRAADAALLHQVAAVLVAVQQ